MKHKTSAVLGVITLLLLGIARPALAAPCVNDGDCKGKRVCRAGACTTPTACGRDRECPGEEICAADKLCRLPNAPEHHEEAAVRPEPAPIPAACRLDKECPGEQICSGGGCVQPTQRAAAVPMSLPPRAVEAAPALPPSPPPQLAPPPVLARFAPESGQIRDNDLRVVWKSEPKPDPLEYIDAKEYCASLSGPGVVWRLPSVEELISVTAKPVRKEMQAAFGNPVETVWSSTESSRLHQWVVSLRFGTKLDQTVRDRAGARCVRAL